MAPLAVIGGSGLYRLTAMEDCLELTAATPYGDVALQRGRLAGRDVLFLPRHGPGHRLPPHAINYRANIWALRGAGAQVVLAVNAVGGIAAGYAPGTLALPDQLIDYTWGRISSFDEAFAEVPLHLEFAEPFAGSARAALAQALAVESGPWVNGGTYGVTQGPRLETRAEIQRLARDGCHMVGMTALPEAALARELGLDYAALCAVVNWAAGVGGGDAITMADVLSRLDQLRPRIEAVLQAVAANLPY